VFASSPDGRSTETQGDGLCVYEFYGFLIKSLDLSIQAGAKDGINYDVSLPVFREVYLKLDQYAADFTEGLVVGECIPFIFLGSDKT
jgi:hypothetical protein